MTSALGGGEGGPPKTDVQGGVWSKQMNADKGGGVKKSENFEDVTYGSPLRQLSPSLMYGLSCVHDKGDMTALIKSHLYLWDMCTVLIR